MRILAIQPFLKGYTISPVAGGKNKACLRLMQYLVSEGHEVFVFPWYEHLLDETPFRLGNGGEYATVLPTVTFSSAGKVIRSLPALVSSKQLLLHPKKHLWGFINRLVFDRETALIEAMEKVQPDVVHVHHTRSDFPQVYRKLGHTVPLMLTHTHGVGTHLNHYDRIVFPSVYQRDKICQTYPSLESVSRVIYYPVDDVYRQSVPVPRGDGIVFIGNLKKNERKGLDILLKAYMDEPALNQWTLTIIGDGPMRPAYKQMVSGRNLNVHFVGRVSHEENARLMAAAKLFVLPSREESFGIVYAEALCMGLPIIGYPPSVQELTGLLGIPVGMPFDATTSDHNQLGSLIERMMSSDGRFDEITCQELARRAGQMFSIEKFGSEYTACYQEIIAANSDK